MIASMILCSLTISAFSQEELRLPIIQSAIIHPRSTSESGTQPGNYVLMSEDGYRSFENPRRAYREGPIAYEFWPPSRIELHMLLARTGSDVVLTTGRQYLSYRSIKGEEPSTLDADVTPIRAEKYQTLTFLATRIGEAEDRWSAVMRTDIDRLGVPKSTMLWKFDRLAANRAVFDCNAKGVLIQALGEWYVCEGKAAPRKIATPVEFDAWALDIDAELIVGSIDNDLVLLNPKTGGVIRHVVAPASPSGGASAFFSSATLGKGRVIVCFRSLDASGYKDRMRLYETSRTGKLAYLGPFDLQGASPNGKVLLLGRGFDNITRLVVWPRQ